MRLVTVEGFHPPSVRVLVVEGLGAEVADLQLVPVLHEVLKQKYQTGVKLRITTNYPGVTKPKS